MQAHVAQRRLSRLVAERHSFQGDPAARAGDAARLARFRQVGAGVDQCQQAPRGGGYPAPVLGQIDQSAHRPEEAAEVSGKGDHQSHRHLAAYHRPRSRGPDPHQYQLGDQLHRRARGADHRLRQVAEARRLSVGDGEPGQLALLPAERAHHAGAGQRVAGHGAQLGLGTEQPVEEGIDLRQDAPEGDQQQREGEDGGEGELPVEQQHGGEGAGQEDAAVQRRRRDDVEQECDVGGVLLQARHQLAGVAGGVEAHRQALQRVERGALEGDFQVVDEGGVDPAPGDAKSHLGEAGEQNKADGQQHHAGEAALRREYLVEQKAPGQERRHHRGAGAAGKRQAEHRQPPVLAARHHGDQTRQHAPRVLGLGGSVRRLRRARARVGPVLRFRARSSPAGYCGGRGTAAGAGGLQEAVGGIHERLRLGGAHAGVARQEQGLRAAPRADAPAAQVGVGGERRKFIGLQPGHRAAADLGDTLPARHQPLRLQAPVTGDVGPERCRAVEAGPVSFEHGC